MNSHRRTQTRDTTILTVPQKLKAANLWENLTPPELIEHALRHREGVLGRDGQFIVDTRPHTGRSPKDKAFVKEPSSEQYIDWGDTNRPIDESVFDALFEKVEAYLSERDVYSLDCYVGADERYRVPIRVYSEFAWHNLFAHHLFITPENPVPGFSPEFTVVDAALFQADPKRDGVPSSTFILVNFERRIILIGGTRYAGEIKKSIFTVMNYLLPLRDTLPMHCSANVGTRRRRRHLLRPLGNRKDDALVGSAPSADRRRRARLVERWRSSISRAAATRRSFVFRRPPSPRFGPRRTVSRPSSRTSCTTIARASSTSTPKRKPRTRARPIRSTSFRISCPAARAANPARSSCSPPMRLACCRRSPNSRRDQAMYHFLSGYTAKVAGTERGVTEPTATFSTCFGAPFMVHHPTVYAKLLGERIDRHEVECWLVNTGWTGGGYGVGKRMSIAHTRAMVNAAIEGRIPAEFEAEPFFGLRIPKSVPDVPSEVLNPRNVWADKNAYDEQARKLVGALLQQLQAIRSASIARP